MCMKKWDGGNSLSQPQVGHFITKTVLWQLVPPPPPSTPLPKKQQQNLSPKNNKQNNQQQHVIRNGNLTNNPFIYY